jgi:hypothetical protein
VRVPRGSIFDVAASEFRKNAFSLLIYHQLTPNGAGIDRPSLRSQSLAENRFSIAGIGSERSRSSEPLFVLFSDLIPPRGSFTFVNSYEEDPP